jgi:uncharacterized protein
MTGNPLFDEQGRILLTIARSVISSALGQDIQTDERAVWLQEEGACFVTLKQAGVLRGCIGTLEARRSLLLDVKANAHAAAFRDVRFSALTAVELPLTDIEVSLLSPLQALQFSSEREALLQLKPQEHGVVFELGRYRSTFLPQVWEQLPNVIEFMAHLKYKAGLPADFWSSDVKLSYYTVSKWTEEDVTNMPEVVNDTQGTGGKI